MKSWSGPREGRASTGRGTRGEEDRGVGNVISGEREREWSGIYVLSVIRWRGRGRGPSDRQARNMPWCRREGGEWTEKGNGANLAATFV